MEKSTSLIPTHAIYGFIGISSVLFFLWIPFYHVVQSKITLVPKSIKHSLISNSFKWIICVFSLALIIFSSWFRTFFGQLTPEQVLFNLQSPIVGTAEGMAMEIWYSPIFSIVTVAIVLAYIIFSKSTIALNTSKKSLKSFRRKRWSYLLITALFCFSVFYTTLILHLDQVAKAYYDSSDYIQQNYVDIRQTNPRFPEQKRNLIFIHLESVENSYFDKSLGGYMNDNLMPELAEITKEGIQFSHNEKMGGPHQTYGSGWSVASMVNMTCGIPVKIAMDNNDYGLSGQFLPSVYNLGNLLHDNGYEQTIMFGSDADFGGLSTFFTQHGNYNIFDHKHAKKLGLIPNDYAVWWGYEDDKLFEYAKTELTRLAQGNKPFQFMMETADTHFPNGYMTPTTPKKYDSQYANVIAHSSKQVSEFIRWIQKQPFYNNTTVVITGDHLSMDAEFFKDFNPQYERTIYNVILNSPITTEHTKNRHYSPVDFYPTILASIGVEFDGNRAGLGTNLFSNVPTLIERDGLEKFNDELSKNSTFYNKEFFIKK
ncbi:LTA synthase family protein [Granulicatella sp. WM01]|uniref:LTA synthase family protein n=2 Tax=unclassified Granulicatella TaxID=2630493 RepID=UPI00142F960F|nr:LTA synthase family protein [Granulicatella sp. WM01]